MSHAFIESLVPKTPNDNDNIVNFHIDINKCRKNIFYYSKYDYADFKVMDTPEVYNKEIHNKPGIYFIETKRYFPVRGNGWYYLPMVDYLLENKYITHDNIKYTVQAQLSIKHDYYNTFIDKCYGQLYHN